VVDAPIDPVQLRLAQRRLLAALRRRLRREPLRSDVRVDALIADLRDGEPSRASRHRGRQPLTLGDGELRRVVDAMTASGQLVRSGHRVRLADPSTALDPIMGDRIDRLMTMLGEAGAAPPAVEGAAARIGIPVALIDQLRAAGELVPVGPRIDYPRAAWTEIAARLDLLEASTPLSARLVRDELQTTRRHAEAILRRRRAERDRRGVG
jgi:hypothetical protein